MGLRRIEDKLIREAEMKKEGSEMLIRSLGQLSEKINSLHTELQDLEEKYQKDFKKNPKLSQRLMEVRKELGLPPAIGIYDVGSKKSFMNRFKNIDEYHNYIALRIVKIGEEKRRKTGGILSISEIALALNEQDQGITISISDIVKALKLLEKNKMIYAVKELSGLRIVEFIDPKISEDQQVVLELAARRQGELNLSEIINHTSWTIERVNSVTDSLIQQKISYKRKTLDGIIFTFPGL